MRSKQSRSTLGVVGGMGPLASAEFIKTIYQCSLSDQEQRSPIVKLSSDPTYPDRTEVLLSGAWDTLLQHLLKSLHELKDQNCSSIVICCVTIHHLLSYIEDNIKNRVISLIDRTLLQVDSSSQKHLMLCTSGTNKLKLFQQHALWSAVKDRVVFPEEADQELIHHLVYQIKSNQGLDPLVVIIEELLCKYGVSSFIVGCTEFHLLVKHPVFASDNARGYTYIDALMTIAQELAQGDL